MIQMGIKRSHRIEWVDVAKGIAILLMVMGHEVRNQWVYTIIFSFHMPLFFILSGYTSRPVKSWQLYIQKFQKSFTRIWLVAVSMTILFAIEYKLFNHDFALTHQILWGNIWGSNIYSLNIISVQIMWFLFTFFWAKLLFDLFQIVFNDQTNSILLLIMTIISIHYCNGFKHWLPQTFDLVPIAALFMWCGYYFRKHQKKFLKYWQMEIVLSAIIWAICIYFKLHIELAIRSYPHGLLTIIEAVCGTVVVCFASKILTKFHEFHFLRIAGQHTLLMMCIHQLDFYFAVWFRYVPFGLIAMIVRTVIDVLIFIIALYIGKNYLKDKYLIR